MASVLIPQRLAFGPRGCASKSQVRLGFDDITASEFRKGRYEVCHFHKKDLGGAIGPLAWDQTLWFAHELDVLLKSDRSFVVVEYELEERQNAAALVGAFLVLRHGWSAEQVCRLLPEDANLKFPCSWIRKQDLQTKHGAPRMSVKYCWEGVEMARRLGWVKMSHMADGLTASLAASKFWKGCFEYDGSWLVPSKIFVMADPVTTIKDPNPHTCQKWQSEGSLNEEDIPEPPSPGDVLTPMREARLQSRRTLAPLEASGTGKNGDKDSRTTSSTTLGERILDLDDNVDHWLDDISVHTVCKNYGEGDALGTKSCELWPEAKPLVDFLLEEGIKGVIRVNKSSEPGLMELGGSYQPKQFSEHGIMHADVPVSDSIRDTQGACPTMESIKTFLEEVCEMGFEAGSVYSSTGAARDECASFSEPGAILIHCKGGFGRSVVLACCAIIHLYDVPGRALLGWSRLARPGAVTTPEQEAFLISLRGRADLYKRCGFVTEMPDAVANSADAQTCCVVS